MADSSNSGIDVLTVDGGFLVTFPFDSELLRMIRNVDGANWDKEEQAWRIPASSAESLDKVVKSMEFELKALTKDHQEILKLAHESAMSLMQARKADKDALPHIRDDYVERIGSQDGVILNVNGRFAAQASGHDLETGMQYVKIHRTAVLKTEVFKGDNVRITYNENQIGTVTDISQKKTKDDLLKEFDATMYQVIDGVVVGEKDGKFQIKFPYNEEMQERLRRIDGAEYNHDEEAWEIDSDKKEFVVRAVNDIRKVFVADSAERQQLLEHASTMIDNPKVWNPSSKDGKHYGNIEKVTERYVLQYKGKGEFQLHIKENLSEPVEKGKRYDISYSNRKGQVKELNKEKSTSLAR